MQIFGSNTPLSSSISTAVKSLFRPTNPGTRPLFGALPFDLLPHNAQRENSSLARASQILKLDDISGYYTISENKNGGIQITLARTFEPFAKAERTQSENTKTDGYSTAFCKDLERGNQYYVHLTAASDSIPVSLTANEPELKDRLDLFSGLLPHATVRGKVSEIAHQGALAAPVKELTAHMLADNYFASNKMFEVDIQANDKGATVKATALMTLQHPDLPTKENLTITITRTMQTAVNTGSQLEQDHVEYVITIPPTHPLQKNSGFLSNAKRLSHRFFGNS